MSRDMHNMTDKEIFQLWQENARKKVKELDEAIEILIRLRVSYSEAAETKFVPETWRE
jgi:flagellin-specific chaperone FliS